MMSSAKPHPATEMITKTNVQTLARELKVGDVVFIHVTALPFQKISSATESWTNHVGIVIDINGDEPVVAESRFPFSGSTTLSRFIKRSKGGRVAVSRVHSPLTATEQKRIQSAAQKRSAILYDTGFNLHSKRQFCSRFVREVLDDATGIKLGEIESLATIFKRNPDTDLRFWGLWYFGNIPWQRETVTPASLLRCPNLRPVFDGVATKS